MIKLYIPQSVQTGNQEISNWSFEASHHPSPNKTSWKTTNDLSRCKRGQLRVDPYLQRISTTTNTDLVVRGDKTYEKGKEDFALYCPVTWQDMKGSRTIKNVKAVNAFVCDIDGVTHKEMDELLNDKLVGVCHVAYSSFSHCSKIKFPTTTSNCAFRIVLAVSRPIKAHEYLRVWRYMRQYIPTDIQTKDPSRLWFYPSALESRVDTAFCSGSDGAVLDIDAILSLVPAQEEKPMPNQPTPQPTRAAEAYAARRSGDSDDRYTVVRCPANYPIRGYDGSTHEFGWYIQNWDKLKKHSTGNVQCYATGSGSLGSAFISRSVDIWGVPRYRFTMCNSKKVHMDCIVTDHELEIRYGDKNRSWTYLKSPDNLINMLELLFQDKLWFCEVRQRLFMDKEPINDAREIEIMNLLRKKFYHGQTLSLDMVRQALLLFGDSNSCNPLRDYLEGLKGEWDGTSRLDNLLHDWLGARDKLASIYGKKWAISCVARVLSPGCKVDTMLVLKAPQGHGKGTFFRTLAGTCARTGYSWYNSSKINIGEKDGRSILRTAWIHEMAELSSMAKKDANVIKNFLDEQHDTFRPVYRTHEVKEPRQCVFTGSTNDDDIGIFKDKTGSRRYWFLQLQGKEHHMAYNPKDLAKERDQIWAEAVYLFEQGHVWWLTPQEQEQSSTVNASHAVQSIHETLVEDFLEEIQRLMTVYGGKICFTIKEMLQEIYTDDEGKPTIQRPANYENYYPALLLRLGAKQENNGKKCRRTNRTRNTVNTTGWWSV